MLKRRQYFSLFSALLMITSLIITPVAAAIDEGFYSANNILYYDPEADACLTGQPVGQLTPEEKIGQLLWVGFDNSSIGDLKTMAQKYQLGGVYLNIQDPSKLTAANITEINSAMKSQLIVASDDEGGQVHRMINDEPSAKKLGTMTVTQVQSHGNDTGVKLKKLGLNTVLAPVLDIDTGLKNAISPYDRSFSKDPAVIAQKAGAWADGVTGAGVGVTFKHFPGIGSNVGNTDEQYVVMSGNKTKIEQFTDDLIPYNDAKIKAHVASSVMLANFVLPGWGEDPVSVNSKAVAYLKSTVGYGGLVTTDDLGVMSKSGYGSHKLSIDQAVVKALNAKVDMPLFGYPGDAEMTKIIAAVKSGVDSTVIDAAYANVMKYKTDLKLNTTAPSTAAATTGGTSSVVAGGDNEQKIFNFFISTPFKATGGKPFNAVQAAGAVGNFYQESGWRFDAIQNGKGETTATDTSSGRGYGIAQWDSDRRVTLIALGTKMGKKWSDPEVQFEMIKNELNTGEGDRLAAFQGGKFLTTTDPKEASYLFMASYERAGTPAQENRDKAAVAAYNKYKGLAPGTAFESTCLPGGGTTTATSDGSKATFVTKDGYAVYIQTDPRWANDPYSSTTIGRSSCGPSSMTMIITALTGKAMDIHEVVKVAGDGGMYVPGQGSSWEVGPYLAKHYNLKSKHIPKTVAAVNEAVRGGGYVIMSGRGSVPFTSGGHYIHIRGITPDGKWLVGDSAHRAANEQPWDPNFILSMAADNLVSITK